MGEPFSAGIQPSACGEIPLRWNDDDLELYFNIEKLKKTIPGFFKMLLAHDLIHFNTG